MSERSYAARALLLALAMLPAVVLSAPRVSGIALLPDCAAVEIGKLRHLLRASEASPGRVQLSAAASRGAYQAPVPAAVRIGPDNHGRYKTTGRINGLAVEFLVDTGSAWVALNTAQAARLGLDFRRIGTRMLVSTASGRAAVAYRLTLDRVQVGSIRLTGVPAMVIDGAAPAMPLLGMSFLGRLRLRHEGRLLILEPVR